MIAQAMVNNRKQFNIHFVVRMLGVLMMLKFCGNPHCMPMHNI
jgi:hypothetical protein